MNHKLAGFFCCFLAAAGSIFGQGVVINEIMYHPSTENVLEEYIELYNAGLTAANLQGWHFSKGVSFTFTNATVLAPGTFLVVAANVAAFQAKYPGIANVVGNWVGGLSNQGEEIELENDAGENIDSVVYADEGDWATRQRGPNLGGTRGWEWFAAHDGLGSSLELRNPLLSNDNGQNWGSSATNSLGTPGRQNTIRIGDLPPMILDVHHFPLVPRASNTVTVTARFVDETPARVTAVVRYRVLANPFDSVPMLDDGLHNDGVAKDGIYGATLPMQNNGTVVEFYVEATDGDNIRTWPAAAIDENGIPTQSANVAYQVDEGSYNGTQAVLRLVLTEQERLTLQNINRNSDAQMNATLLVQDGTTSEAIYNVGVRIRGAGSRSAAVPNYRVNIPSDRLWNDLSGVNLNTQYGHSQVAGSAVALKSGLLAAEARPVQVRVNGVNLAATSVQNGFGSYALVEAVNGDLAKHHLPTDPDGNVYRASIPADPGADLTYQAPGTPARYIARGYSKVSNTSENDWSDLTNLTYRLDPAFTPDSIYVQGVTSVVNVRQWMTYFAVVTLTGYGETALGSGQGDDYALYRGIVDPRFSVISHDFDTIFGQGQGPAGSTRDIFFATQLPIVNRFMRHPDFVPIYFAELQRLIDTTFNPTELNPLLDRLLSEFVPQTTINAMKQAALDRRAYVASQIPQNISITSSLSIIGGFPQSSSATVSLNGRANAIQTRIVLVNGVPANWTAWQASWTISNLRLNPGINRVLVQSLDANGREFERATIDIWYNDGTLANVSGALSASTTTWSPAAGPYNVTANATVPVGSTLIIQPGTTVYFAQGTTLTINGRLVAEGNQTNRIRLTRDPSGGNTWGGLRFNNTTEDNRLTYADVDFATTGDPIMLANSSLFIDYVNWSNTTQTIIELDNSSLLVRHSVFPNLTAHEHIHGGPMPTNGYVIIDGNIFGTTTGLNDIIDFSGAQRPGPVLQILNNVFTGASDDVLDLDGTDTYIEGNVFLHVHNGNFSAPDTSSAISFGQDGGYGPQIVAVRNLFVDVDHIALVKEGGSLTLENNTALGIGVAAVNFSEPERGTVPGAGAILDGNIFWNPGGYLGTNFQNRFPTNGAPVLSAQRNIFAAGDGLDAGVGNLNVDPRLSNTVVSAISYLTISNDLSLLNGSLARGTGPNGIDRGAFVPAGPSLSGVPISPAPVAGATITVGGPGIRSYLYRLNNGAATAEFPVGQPIVLANLNNGTNQLTVQARNWAGVLLTNLTVTRTWVVNTNLTGLRINEVLARNDLIEHADAFPDLVELYNAGSAPLNLGGIGLTDDPAKRHQFTFPAGTMLGAGQYLVVYADTETSTGFHLGFSFDQNGDALYLYDSLSNGAGLLDSISFGLQLPNLSIGRLPGGGWNLTQPTLGAANVAQPTGRPELLLINEWLADGRSSFQDDFLELYNSDTLPTALGGLYLSDEPLGDPTAHRIAPLSFIAARGHFAFVADGDATPGANHLNFRLAPEQGRIGLFNSDLTLIDCVIYDQQFTDVSYGRRPSGSGVFSYFGPLTQTQPTPGAPNPGPAGSVTVTNIVIDVLSLASSWRYDNSGIDRGTAWRATAFDDSGWNSGQALLGVESSTLPPPGLNTRFGSFNSSQPTYYFRTSFVLTNDLSGFNLLAQTVIDDGAVVYLNGNELLRLRMPSTAITFNTEAQGPSVDNATLEAYVVPAGGFVMGMNVLAIEVHQATLPSSDIVMGFGLQASRTITNTPTIQVSLNEVMANNLTTALLATPNDTNITDWVELFNAADIPFDLSGLSLSDSLSEPTRWVFPAGSSIGPRSYRLVRFDPATEPSTNAGVVLNTGFGLSAGGDAVYMFDRATNGGVIIDSIQFGIQAADFSIGRLPNASGPWTLTLATPGAVNLAANLGVASNLRLNEWLANPSGNDEDYFEIFNPNPQPVDIGGLFLTDVLTDRTKYKIPVLSFIGTGDNAFGLFTADSNPSAGADHTNFRLATDGEALGIFNAAGTQIDGINFGRQDNGVSEGRFPDGSATVARFAGTATPGRSNILPLTDVVVNEVLSHTDDPLEDAIELHNLTQGSIDISGWFLSDDNDNPTKFKIPAGTILPPNGFVVFYEYQFNPDFSGRAPSFALSSANGDDVFLSAADAEGKLSGFRAQESFGPAKNGVSLGRYQSSVGLDFVALRARTFGFDSVGTLEQFRTGTGRANALPKVGPVVIDEIMYHPPGTNTAEEALQEYIELVNISGAAVPMFDPAFPTNTWRLRDAVQFRFPTGITLAAGERVLIVGFDATTNAAIETAFRARYSVPAGVRIFGPFDGQLNNSDDSVELTQPDDPEPIGTKDAGFVPYVLVDRVNYSDTTPWPSAADGSTNGVAVSLQRKVSSDYGNDPVNWLAGAATAGAATGPAISGLPVITASPVNRTVLQGASVILTAQVSGPGPLSYQWRRDGMSLPGATNATLVIVNAQFTNSGNYTLRVSNPAATVLSDTAVVIVQAPPLITKQPVSLAVTAEATAIFTVSSRGTAPLLHQWYKDGVLVAGATNALLTVTNVQPVNEGAYQVVITNSFGSVTSLVANLFINTIPSITTQPRSTNIFVGADLVLSVSAAGTPPLRYQWRRNNLILAGRTNATLSFSNLQVTDSGTYTVQVINNVGSIVSDPAVVEVRIPPTLSIVATDPSASEPGSDTGTFTITRGGSTNTAVTVSYAVGGGALPGTDYTPLAGSILIPAGVERVTLLITPLNDGTPEGDDAVVVTLNPGAGYVLGSPLTATVIIRDEDNLAPAVTLTNPLNNATFAAGANVRLGATATDSDGTIAKVSFYYNQTNFIGEVLSAPYVFTFSNAPAGQLSLTAVATDNLGSTASSAPVLISVNALPVVAITSPGTGASFNSPATITISASASDADGSIAQVEFFSGTTRIGISTNAGASTLAADYRFGGTRDSLITPAPALTDLGNNSFTTATVDGTSRTVLRFGANDGLTLPSASNLISNNVFTIAILFRFDLVNEFRRVLDFRNGTSDNGLYVFDGGLIFYPPSSGPSGVFTSNTFIQVVLTRDSARTVTGYINGIQQFSFVDSSDLVTLDSSNAIRLFRDDATEGSAGAIARLRIFNVALPASQVAGLDRLPGAGSGGSIYSVVWPNVGSGNYSLTARATDNVGATATSAPVNIVVSVPRADFSDNFATRGILTGTTNFVTGNNSTYSREANEPRHDLRNGARSAWISWTAPFSGNCLMDTLGSGFDTVLAVYTGTSLSALQRITSGDDTGALLQSTANFTAEAGVTYQIAVDGYGSLDAGTISFHISLQSDAPFITTQPQNFTVNRGSPVSLIVAATGANPFQYQWYFNGAVRIGATNATLSLSNIQAVDDGLYNAVVSNNSGSATSQTARVTVRVAPTITDPPLTQVVDPGSNVLFTATVAGSSPLTYQWRFNGVVMTSETNLNLALANVAYTNGGTYRLTVGNSAGSVNSQDAELIVRPRVVFGQMRSNGLFQLTIHGVPGTIYNIESSSNSGQWNPLGNVTNSVVQSDYIDVSPRASVWRFYRLRRIP